MSKLPLTYRDHAVLVHFAHTLTDQSAALSRFSSREIFISVALAFPVKKKCNMRRQTSTNFNRNQVSRYL